MAVFHWTALTLVNYAVQQIIAYSCCCSWKLHITAL